MKHTYNSKYQARLGNNPAGNQSVIIPDMVATHQKDFDGKTFFALKPADGTYHYGSPYLINGCYRIRVKLRGDWYGLHTSGTGDMIVQRV